MKISKIEISNVFGISEFVISPENITEISGKTGAGKTSVLDALKLVLTNKGARTKYIKENEKEAELFIKTDSGIEISRTKKREGTDKITIKENGLPIDDTPQHFLNKLFSEEQFNPLKFVEMTSSEQKKVLLSLIEIEWNEQNFVEWFGEVPAEVEKNLEKHILEILEKLGSDKSKWYIDREELGRQKRQKEAIRNDFFKNIPENYNPEDWRNLSLSDKYSEIEKKSSVNNQINKCKEYLQDYENKINALDNKYVLKIKEQEEMKEFKIDKAKKEIEKSKEILLQNIENKEKEILELEKKILELKNEIKNNKEKIEILQNSTFEEKKISIEKEIDAIISGINENKKIEIEKYEDAKKQSEKYISENKEENIQIIKESAEYAEKMKSFIADWDRAIEKDKEIFSIKSDIELLTNKIDYARKLPSELIEKSNLPIKELKIKNGEILIENSHGEYMMIDGLSDGEKMKLAIKIASLKSKDLGVVFCDGTEKLDDETYKEFVAECAKTGIQFFFTRTKIGEFEVKTYNL